MIPPKYLFPQLKIKIKVKTEIMIKTKICMVSFCQKIAFESVQVHVREERKLHSCCCPTDHTGTLKEINVFWNCIVFGFTLSWLGTVCVMSGVVPPDGIS